MKKHFYQTILILLALLLTMVGSAIAEDVHTGHSMDMTDSMALDQSADQGMTVIRETVVDDYPLAYHLIDMQARMRAMENMPTMENTHHLMVYITTPCGHAVEGARVGFLITGPDAEKQKVMAMGMSGGYGADINMKAKGTYTISVKAIMGETELKDSFTYENK